MNRLILPALALVSITALMPLEAHAHPHVFVEANIDVLRNDEGKFSEIRHVWRFDELFSSTIILDYDADGDSKLSDTELSEVTKIVKQSIAEYDFYTAVRHGEKEIEFYEPETINAYYDDGRLIMFLSLELAKPLAPTDKPLKISASDTSYYVAFDFDTDNISVAGNNAGCSVDVTHPDFDSLYAGSSQALTESFFNDPSKPAELGDEFYSWASISCS